MLDAVKTIQGVSYGRVSTIEQACNDDGSIRFDASPQMQKVRCVQYIAEQTKKNQNVKYQLLDHISDDGYSAKNTKRPGYQKLINLIENKKIQFVVSTELSRISRNVADFLNLHALCKKNGVDLMIVGAGFDSTTPMGMVMTTILVALAQFERETTSMRVRENAVARLMSDGKINGACTVLGLDKDPDKTGHFLINKKEVGVLINVFEIFLRSATRVDALKEIIAQNILWKNSEIFTKTKLNRTLASAQYRYRGLWPHKNKNGQTQLCVLPHGPLVSLELLDQVEEKLKILKSKKRKPGKGYTYLLTTLLEFEDGTRFYGHPAKQRQYRYYYNQKHHIRIECDELDGAVAKRFWQYFSDDEYFKKLIVETHTKRKERIPEVDFKIENLKEELKKIFAEEVVLKTQILGTNTSQNPMLSDWFEKLIVDLANRKSSLESEISQLEGHKVHLQAPIPIELLKDTMKVFKTHFKKASNGNKKAIYEKILQRVVIKSSNEVELHFYDDVFKGVGKSLQSKQHGGTTRT